MTTQLWIRRAIVLAAAIAAITMGLILLIGNPDLLEITDLVAGIGIAAGVGLAALLL